MPKRSKKLDTIAWALAGLAGLALLIAFHPRAARLEPEPYRLTRGDAVAIALERLRVLGPPVHGPFLVAQFAHNQLLMRQLQLASHSHPPEELRRSGLVDQALAWHIYVYPRRSNQKQWTYRADVAVSGRVLELFRAEDPKVPAGAISREQARKRADAFLAFQGVDLRRYGEPVFRSTQLEARTDLSLRYREKGEVLGAGRSYGVEVDFAGDRLQGFTNWVEDPREHDLALELQDLSFTDLGREVVLYLLLSLVAIPFLRRYHAGEIGVRRGAQIMLVVFVCSLALAVLTVVPSSENFGFGSANREQTAVVFFIALLIFYELPAALLAFFAWSVGESVCRERWGHKLAAFDAMLRNRWANATVARASLVGLAGGLVAAGLTTALWAALIHAGVWPMFSLNQSSGLPGIGSVTGFVAGDLPLLLTAVLWLLPLAVRKLGSAAGTVCALAAALLILPPPVLSIPLLGWGLVAELAWVAVPVLLFLRVDLLSALLCSFVGTVLLAVYPLLTSDSSALRAQGWLGVLLAAAPFLASVRWLGSSRELEYHYEDVPPHVRRIAERERQRVELETARRIQSSILPDLPPRLAGMEISHCYLPASEVGGDFYDVLALEDGRLAVAVGDVAGHGVSSGLIMSMAKSALAVQVTFDPEVRAVFETLNRTVYQTARKRLLTTFCYALVDPRRHEMLYASAGHLYPYRITRGGRVEALESTGYPLGVRSALEVQPRSASLAAGDTLFLFSDGLVEARAEGSEEMFGFDRLEGSLAEHSGASVEGLREGVLEDVGRFTRNSPRDDDLTILVLRLSD